MKIEMNYKAHFRPCRWRWKMTEEEWECGIFHMFLPGNERVGAVLETGNGKVLVIHDILALVLQFTDELAGEIFDLSSRPESGEPT